MYDVWFLYDNLCFFAYDKIRNLFRIDPKDEVIFIPQIILLKKVARIDDYTLSKKLKLKIRLILFKKINKK